MLDSALTIKYVPIDELVPDLSEELQVVFSILEAEEIFVLSVVPLCLELTVKTPEADNCELELKILIPHGYPSEASLKCKCFVKCKWAIYDDTKKIEEILRETISQNEGCPQMYELICSAQAFLEESLAPMKRIRKNTQSYVAAAKPICKFFNYSQKNQDKNDLEQKLRGKVQKTMRKMNIGSSDAIRYLQKNQWKVPGKGKRGGESKESEDKDISPPAMVAKKSYFDVDDVRILRAACESYKCNVCIDEYPIAQGITLSCGHWACLDCFTGYLESQIGSGELAPKCVGCSETVPECLIMNLVSEKAYSNAKNGHIKNYLNQYPKFKGCPSNECQTVFYFSGGKKLEAYPFSACENCQSCFCSECLRPSHWPLKCQDVATSDSVMSQFENLFDIPDAILLTEDSISRLYRKITNEFRSAYKSFLNQLWASYVIPDDYGHLSDVFTRPQFNELFISSFLNDKKHDFAWQSTFLISMEPIFWKYCDFAKNFLKYIDELSGIQQDLLVRELLMTLRERFGFDQVGTDKVIDTIKKRRKRDKFRPEEHIVTIESKPCPHCATPWTKNGGCKHMHCRTCGHHFCWDCGQPYTIDTHPSFWECPMRNKVRQKQTAMVLSNNHDNEFVEKAEAMQRNDGVGLGISFQVLNACDEMMVKLRSTLNDSRKLSLFSKKAGSDVSTHDIALVVSTVRMGYMILHNGYRRHILKSSLSRFSEVFMTMQDLEAVLERFDTFADDEPTYFPVRNTLKWSMDNLVQAVERTLFQFQEHFCQPELPPEDTYVPSRFNLDRGDFDEEKYGVRV